MLVSIHVDNTLPLPLDLFCARLSGICKSIAFRPGNIGFRFDTEFVSYPDSYQDLPKNFLKSVAADDHVILATAVQYDNNYFFEGAGKLVIVSFAGWNLLTNLPVTNGLAYFIAALLGGQRHDGAMHEENTGCLNDQWWDKTGVDVGMRAAFLCNSCSDASPLSRDLLNDVKSILDFVSSASRANMDILQASNTEATASSADAFDVFLCHNSNEKSEIRRINKALQQAGLRTWLDEEQIPLGSSWQVALEQQIKNVRAACVCVGNSGFGPWQDVEVRAFLSQFVRRSCPVIPVIMPSAKTIPELPIFLQELMWLDLRREYDSGMQRLISTLRRHR